MKRLICAFILTTISFSAFSASIKCYSNGRTIYSGVGQDVVFDGQLFYLREHATNNMVYVNGDCIIKITENDMKKAKKPMPMPKKKK